MRYPQGGGLTPERQAFRERIRLEAAERFAAGASTAEVARELRGSVRSVQRWPRACQEAGRPGLRSTGSVSLPKLSDALFAVLEKELDKGPVAYGWRDQTWTLALRVPITHPRRSAAYERPAWVHKEGKNGTRSAIHN
jgi:transposase